MSVLVLKNIAAEGPGTIEGFLVGNGMPYTVVDLSMGEPIPQADGFDTLVMMGGPMSVNDDLRYIRDEEALVREFVAAGKKIFGICLGAQIMAKALGAMVYMGAQKEIGWYDIELTGGGLKDPLMNRLAVHPMGGDIWKRFKVFHWHGETFDIPEGAERLASSDLFSNQAFRYGKRAYAFQFHIEVEKESVYEWLKDEVTNLPALKKETEGLYEVYLQRAMNFYKAFFIS
jgi:GMP synthase-like glutamine amidotransferase